MLQFPQPAPCSLLVPSQRHTKVLSYPALCILLPSFLRSTQDTQCWCFSLPQHCIQGGGSPTYNIASCLTNVSPTSDVSSLTLSGPHTSPYHRLADRQHHKDTQLSQPDILVSFEQGGGRKGSRHEPATYVENNLILLSRRAPVEALHTNLRKRRAM